MTVKQARPAGTSLAEGSAAAIKVETVLRGIDGIKDVQTTSGNAQTGFSALQSTQPPNSSFTVVTEEKCDQTNLQDTVRSELAKISGDGNITFGSQQGGI